MGVELQPSWNRLLLTIVYDFATSQAFLNECSATLGQRANPRLE